jgi:hypothetical protein
MIRRRGHRPLRPGFQKGNPKKPKYHGDYIAGHLAGQHSGARPPRPPRHRGCNPFAVLWVWEGRS